MDGTILRNGGSERARGFTHLTRAYIYRWLTSKVPLIWASTVDSKVSYYSNLRPKIIVRIRPPDKSKQSSMDIIQRVPYLGEVDAARIAPFTLLAPTVKHRLSSTILGEAWHRKPILTIHGGEDVV